MVGRQAAQDGATRCSPVPLGSLARLLTAHMQRAAFAPPDLLRCQSGTCCRSPAIPCTLHHGAAPCGPACPLSLLPPPLHSHRGQGREEIGCWEGLPQLPPLAVALLQLTLHSMGWHELFYDTVRQAFPSGWLTGLVNNWKSMQ